MLGRHRIVSPLGIVYDDSSLEKESISSKIQVQLELTARLQADSLMDPELAAVEPVLHLYPTPKPSFGYLPNHSP